MTKKGIQAELQKLGIKFSSRATKDELATLLKSATEKQAAPAKRPSTKALLREMFDRTGVSRPVDAVYKALAAVKPETVDNMCSDLRNPKYAGGEPIDIQKKDGNFVRVS